MNTSVPKRRWDEYVFQHQPEDFSDDNSELHTPDHKHKEAAAGSGERPRKKPKSKLNVNKSDSSKTKGKGKGKGREIDSDTDDGISKRLYESRSTGRSRKQRVQQGMVPWTNVDERDLSSPAARGTSQREEEDAPSHEQVLQEDLEAPDQDEEDFDRRYDSLGIEISPTMMQTEARARLPSESEPFQTLQSRLAARRPPKIAVVVGPSSAAFSPATLTAPEEPTMVVSSDDEFPEVWEMTAAEAPKQGRPRDVVDKGKAKAKEIEPEATDRAESSKSRVVESEGQPERVQRWSADVDDAIAFDTNAAIHSPKAADKSKGKARVVQPQATDQPASSKSRVVESEGQPERVQRWSADVDDAIALDTNAAIHTPKASSSRQAPQPRTPPASSSLLPTPTSTVRSTSLAPHPSTVKVRLWLITSSPGHHRQERWREGTTRKKTLQTVIDAVAKRLGMAAATIKALKCALHVAGKEISDTVAREDEVGFAEMKEFFNAEIEKVLAAGGGDGEREFDILLEPLDEFEEGEEEQGLDDDGEGWF